MPQLISPNRVNIVTKDGELHVHITLDLNINTDNLTVKSEIVEKKDKTEWAIPDFDSGEKVKFGKND